jgi:hypothetical protein
MGGPVTCAVAVVEASNKPLLKLKYQLTKATDSPNISYQLAGVVASASASASAAGGKAEERALNVTCGSPRTRATDS